MPHVDGSAFKVMDQVNMENSDAQQSEAERQQAVYETARASIAEKHRVAPAAGHVVMASFMGYGESALGNGIFAKVSHGAKLFCILFAMLVPSLLIWQVML